MRGGYGKNDEQGGTILLTRGGGGEKCGEGKKEVNRINEAKGISRPRPGIVRAN
jgi:hypothetical protein